MINEILKFPAGISLGRNFTATKLTCGAKAVFCPRFTRIAGLQWRFLPNDTFRQECEYANKMIIKTNMDCFGCSTLAMTNKKTAERHCEERSDEANQRKNRLIMNND